MAAFAVALSLQPFPLHAGSPAGPTVTVPTPTAPVPVWNAGSPTVTAVVPPVPTATGTRIAPSTPIPSRTDTPTAGVTSTSTATVGPTVAVTPTATSNSGLPVKEQTPPRHYVVLLVIDGGRSSYLSLTKLPYIQALMRNGVVYDRAMVGELESSTPGVHVTLGTGTMPKENGFLGFGWAEPTTRKYVDFRTLLANGQIDPVLKSLPLPSVAARLHQFIPGALSIAASGHKDYAAVGLGGGSSDYLLYGRFGKTQYTPTFLHSPPAMTPAERARLTLKLPLPVGAEDKWAFDYATTVARHVRPHLLMINLPEMDTWGHWNGPADSTLFRKLMVNVDRGVGEIEQTYRELGILNRTDFIITADHAMMQSRAARNWGPIQDEIKSTGAQVARADGAGGSIWLVDPAQAKIVAQKLVAARPQHVQAIFYRSGPGTDYQYIQASPNKWLTKPSVGTALQHLVDTTAGIHGPDLWVLYRENYTTLSRNVSGMWKGTHGGTTWNVQHIPLIISGQDIRKGVHSAFTANAIDIAPTMERLLGLPYLKRDGVVLADAFAAPMPGEDGPQRNVATQRSADADAIYAQSIADQKSEQWSFQHWPVIPSCGIKGKPPCNSTTAGSYANG